MKSISIQENYDSYDFMLFFKRDWGWQSSLMSSWIPVLKKQVWEILVLDFSYYFRILEIM